MSQRPVKTRTAFSAGGVCYRWVDDTPEVALVATLGGARWGLPKGQPMNDESPAETACREVAEETGLVGDVLHPLSSIEYWFRAGSSRIHKSVEFFLLRWREGNITPQLSEVDDARWIPLPEALHLISFPREREILKRVWQLWHDDRLQ